MNKVRVRFAPSPTGPLHIGGARSALFNYLFAVNQKGQLVLRVEDTDLERSKPEYEEEIITSLRWLGLNWDEGVDKGGPHSPYRQTERLSIYQEYAQDLLDKDWAYPCFCTEEELQEERAALMAQGEMPRYSGKCRSLTEEERQAHLDQGRKPALRFKVPENQVYVVHDLVRGQVTFDSDNIGDFIIMKSDGIPTYNFAVVIDDALMGITHVIRAEEHLANTPRQLMIYEALRFKRPEFAHISLILGEDRQKMSKRHGSTSLMEYRELGYLPEALFNFLALLGWSPEGEEEILEKQQIVGSFTLERVSRSPAVFDLEKLNWMNQQYLKKLDPQELYNRLQPFIGATTYSEQVAGLSSEQRSWLMEAVRERMVCLKDIEHLLPLFFAEPSIEEEAQQVLRQPGVKEVLQTLDHKLPDEENPEAYRQCLKAVVKELKLKAKDVFMPARCALTGQVHGPDLNLIMAVWGKKETSRRLQKAIERLDD
jgi:nondiscriminating glutamyl-tRNA synthetase